jgi:hypothetical protein
MIQSDPSKTPEESGISANSAAPRTAVDAEPTAANERETQSPIDPALAKIVAAWPSLPEPIRRAMLALIG